MLETLQTVVNIAFLSAISWFLCKKKNEPNYEDVYYVESRIQYHEDMSKVLKKLRDERLSPVKTLIGKE